MLAVFAERFVDFSRHTGAHGFAIPRRMKFRIGHGPHLIRQVRRAAVPRPSVAYQHAASRRWADSTEFHPLGFLPQLRDFLLAVLGARNLPGGAIYGGEVAGQKVAADIGAGQVTVIESPSGIVKGTKGLPRKFCAVVHIRVQRLIGVGTG